MSEPRIKKYVEVIADFSPEGILTPQTVIWDTGQRFDIPASQKYCRVNTQRPAALGCAIPAR